MKWIYKVQNQMKGEKRRRKDYQLSSDYRLHVERECTLHRECANLTCYVCTLLTGRIEFHA